MSWKRPESPGSFTLMFYLLVKEAANISVLLKKVFLKIHKTHRKIPVSASKKETPTQVFSCEFFEIFKINFFTEYTSGKVLLE